MKEKPEMANYEAERGEAEKTAVVEEDAAEARSLRAEEKVEVDAERAEARRTVEAITADIQRCREERPRPADTNAHGDGWLAWTFSSMCYHLRVLARHERLYELYGELHHALPLGTTPGWVLNAVLDARSRWDTFETRVLVRERAEQLDKLVREAGFELRGAGGDR